MMRILPLLGVFAACAACASSPAPFASATGGGSSVRAAGVSSLRPFVDSLIDSPDFRSANWGILVVDPVRGDTLYSRNADKLFMPASNMKLVTGATALAVLGPDYRWSTTVSARGAVQNGTLAGDLVLRGTGDPSASAHMQKGDALAPLRAIADSLRAHGVTRVAGRLSAAPSVFTDSPIGYGWAADDLDASYSAGVDALYFNEGFTEVVVRSGSRAGDPVTAVTRPASTYPALLLRARTVGRLTASSSAADSAAASAITVSQDSSRQGVLVAGTLAAGDSVVLELAFRDQTTAYLRALREALTSRGITVTDAATDTMARTEVLFTQLSPPLRDVFPFFEKPSQNQIGELLFKTIAREKTGAGRADSASRFVARQLIAWGAEPDGFAVHDGSGLSRHDYLTPRTIIHVLDAVRKDPNFKVMYDALPIAGVDGTIGNRMKNTPAQGNVHGKTGTLDKARSLSGYVTTADGRMLLFSALCNNYAVPTRRVDRVTDALSARLASMRVDAP